MAKKKTFEEVYKEVMNLGFAMKVEPEDYVNSTTKVIAECLTCGKDTTIQPSRIISKKIDRCRDCKGHPHYTKDMIADMFSAKGVKVVGEIPSSINKRVTCECSSGHRFETVARRVRECPECPDSRNLSSSKRIKRMVDRGCSLVVGNVYSKDLYTEVDYYCESGHKNTVKLRNLIYSKGGCVVCAKRAPLSKEEVNRRLEPLDIELVGDFCGLNANHSHILKHNLCGNEWQTNHISNYISGKERVSCGFCQKESRWTSQTRVDDEMEKLPSWKISGFVEGVTKTRDFCLFECRGCGETKEYKLNHLLTTANFFCDNCDERETGFDKNKPGIFYYLRVETDTTPVYKIGITNRTVEQRFYSSDLEKITTLRTLDFDNGDSAAKLEKYYLDLFKDFRYQGPPILSSGNTELFTYDIFALDTPP